MHQDLYIWLKFIHVACVAGWVGGFLALGIMNLAASRDQESKNVAAFLHFGEALGPRLIGPSSGLALLAGLGGMGAGRLGPQLWLLWGITGTILFIAIGVAGMRPVLKQLSAAVARGAAADELGKLLAKQRRLIGINGLILLSVIWAMIFKPV